MPLISQSTSEKQELAKVRVDPTAAGASFDVDGICDDEPMCMLMTVPVSLHAAKNGSQWSVCTLSRLSRGGISLKHTARTPRAALRRTSSAASCASHNGMSVNGMSAPSESPHHSSTIQSLYATTHACASSRSFASRNVWPQKRGNVGNDNEPETQFISLSSTRAFGS